MAVVVSELEMTCPICPSQWEGKTSDGRFVYVRYRYGCLQVSFGDSLMDAVGDETIFKCIGDELHGELTYAELKAAVPEVAWP